MDSVEQPKKRKCGFAAMSPERRREIASKGGKSVPAEKRSFSQNREHAAVCGQKGGKNVDPSHRTFSLNRDLAAKAGALMSPEKRQEVSSKGGKSLPAEKRIFAREPEFARLCRQKRKV